MQKSGLPTFFPHKFSDDYKCRRSYSVKGNPDDNAVIESFHAILKEEEVYRKVYRDFSEAQKSIFKYTEGWYNNRRIHGSIFYMTPNEFEALAVQFLTLCVQRIDLDPVMKLKYY